MIDPLLPAAIAFGFAVLFIGAAWHKLSARGRFEAILRDYRLLPERLVRPLAVLIPVIEWVLALGWVSGLATHFTIFATAALLTSYAFAMTINLVRGRIYIDCGCGFGAATGENPALSSGLVARNIFLIGLALLPLVPTSGRDLGIIDFVFVLASVLTAILLYAGSGQLIQNRAAINTWRVD